MKGVVLALLLATVCSLGSGCGGSGSSDDGPISTPEERYDRLFLCLSNLGLEGESANSGRWPRLVGLNGPGAAVVNARVFLTEADAAQAEAAFRQSQVDNLRSSSGVLASVRASTVRAEGVFATYTGFPPAESADIVACVRDTG